MHQLYMRAIKDGVKTEKREDSEHQEADDEEEGHEARGDTSSEQQDNTATTTASPVPDSKMASSDRVMPPQTPKEHQKAVQNLDLTEEHFNRVAKYFDMGDMSVLVGEVQEEEETPGLPGPPESVRRRDRPGSSRDRPGMSSPYGQTAQTIISQPVDESTLEKDIYSAPRVQVDDVPQGGGGDTQKLSPPSSPMVCASPAPMALGVDALLDWAQQLDLDSGAFDDF